ncbi:hypothetical protein HU200_053546 [Digitaria exilis]|uniref:Uncharacterized protein n=1 Tax=Digitaria exilis TaxID=1010633 RepID=A0A835AH68_9POAL|nr:hypothetical protein HU200_053546 [Digitaria exilis]
MNPELLKSLLNSEGRQDTATTEYASVILQIGREIAGASSQATSLLLRGVTSDGDSALHVVAAAGDRDEHLRSASAIYGKARHLLEARNKAGSTPLHVAARARNVEMLSLLVRFAGEEEEGEERVRTLLRMQNEVGETALHGAIRA